MKDAVVGLMVLKDEWPLCALSVSHALECHVDTLWVVDHGGGEEARAGLAELQWLWGDRLNVLRLDGVGFWQEAITAVLLEACGARERDWIYVLDADEYAITGSGQSLRTVLGALDDDTALVRYRVENWISERDFDEWSLGSYRRLVHRAVPNVFVAEGLEMVEDEIRLGHVNYFDVPFHSKIVFRKGSGTWVASGTHALKDPAGMAEVVLDCDQLRVAHLPLLTRDRLAGRARQGAFLVAHGFPRDHGWQSQMIHRISEEGGLDAFWARHSIEPGGGPGGASCPTSRRDESLVDVLEPTLTRLAKHFGERLDTRRARTGSPHEAAPAATLPLATGVRVARSMQLHGDRLIADNRHLQAGHDRLATERERLVVDRDWLLGERARLEGELAALAGELVRSAADLAEVAAARDGLAVELVRMEDELARASAEPVATHRSIGWRVMNLARGALAWVRRRWSR